MTTHILPKTLALSLVFAGSNSAIAANNTREIRPQMQPIMATPAGIGNGHQMPHIGAPHSMMPMAGHPTTAFSGRETVYHVTGENGRKYFITRDHSVYDDAGQQVKEGSIRGQASFNRQAMQGYDAQTIGKVASIAQGGKHEFVVRDGKFVGSNPLENVSEAGRNNPEFSQPGTREKNRYQQASSSRPSAGSSPDNKNQSFTQADVDKLYVNNQQSPTQFQNLKAGTPTSQSFGVLVPGVANGATFVSGVTKQQNGTYTLSNPQAAKAVALSSKGVAAQVVKGPTVSYPTSETTNYFDQTAKAAIAAVPVGQTQIKALTIAGGVNANGKALPERQVIVGITNTVVNGVPTTTISGTNYTDAKYVLGATGLGKACGTCGVVINNAVHNAREVQPVVNNNPTVVDRRTSTYASIQQQGTASGTANAIADASVSSHAANNVRISQTAINLIQRPNQPNMIPVFPPNFAYGTGVTAIFPPTGQIVTAPDFIPAPSPTPAPVSAPAGKTGPVASVKGGKESVAPCSDNCCEETKAEIVRLNAKDDAILKLAQENHDLLLKLTQDIDNAAGKPKVTGNGTGGRLVTELAVSTGADGSSAGGSAPGTIHMSNSAMAGISLASLVLAGMGVLGFTSAKGPKTNPQLRPGNSNGAGEPKSGVPATSMSRVTNGVAEPKKRFSKRDLKGPALDFIAGMVISAGVKAAMMGAVTYFGMAAALTTLPGLMATGAAVGMARGAYSILRARSRGVSYDKRAVAKALASSAVFGALGGAAGHYLMEALAPHIPENFIGKTWDVAKNAFAHHDAASTVVAAAPVTDADALRAGVDHLASLGHVDATVPTGVETVAQTSDPTQIDAFGHMNDVAPTGSVSAPAVAPAAPVVTGLDIRADMTDVQFRSLPAALQREVASMASRSELVQTRIAQDVLNNLANAHGVGLEWKEAAARVAKDAFGFVNSHNIRSVAGDMVRRNFAYLQNFKVLGLG